MILKVNLILKLTYLCQLCFLVSFVTSKSIVTKGPTTVGLTSRQISNGNLRNATVFSASRPNQNQKNKTSTSTATSTRVHVTHVSTSKNHHTEHGKQDASNYGTAHAAASAHENEASNEHGVNHNTSHGGEHKSDGDSHHHVPPPSYQLQLHLYNYKPDTFHMFGEEIGIKTFVVGFTYTKQDHYDRFIIRVRFHGHEDYTTNKIKINKTDTNQLVLKNFIEASYIICVTLFSSSGLPDYPPLSTSDMCMDLTVGESHPIGGHHSSTGLLSPLLLAVAFVLLFIITVGTKIKKSYLKRLKKKKAENKKKRLSAAVSSETNEPKNDEKISHNPAANSVAERRPSKMAKSPTEQRLDYILNKDKEEEEDNRYDPKWYAAAQKNKIVNSSSTYADFSQARDYSKRRIQRPNIIYENRDYDNEGYDYEDDDDESDYEYYDDENGLEMRDFNDNEIRQRKITSLQTLSHVLDNKPWLQNQSQQQQQQSRLEKF
jgi:hypothetical protein